MSDQQLFGSARGCILAYHITRRHGYGGQGSMRGVYSSAHPGLHCASEAVYAMKTLEKPSGGFIRVQRRDRRSW